MKYLVEQGYRKVTFKTPEDLVNPPKLEEQWQRNRDCMGGVARAYLQRFYGEPVESAGENALCFESRYSFNSDRDPAVREQNRIQRTQEMQRLVALRNFLAHRFGLVYPLTTEQNCEHALRYLNKAKEYIDKCALQLKTEADWFTALRKLMADPTQHELVKCSMERFLVITHFNQFQKRLKSYDFSDMSHKTIFDYIDNKEVIDAVMGDVADKSPAYYDAVHPSIRLSHLLMVAVQSGNKKFVKAVRTQLRNIGIETNEDSNTFAYVDDGLG